LSARARKGVVYAALVVLLLLHGDFWLWSDGSIVLGLPAGLTYHVAYCFVVAAVLAVVVRLDWPADGADEGAEP